MRAKAEAYAGKLIYRLKTNEVQLHGDEVLQYLTWMTLEDQRYACVQGG